MSEESSAYSEQAQGMPAPESFQNDYESSKPQVDTDNYFAEASLPNQDQQSDLSGLDVFSEGGIEEYLDVDSEYGKLPHPDVFNAYPPEIQRKIMEWTDRDVKARRDDESRRRDELMRAEIDNERRKQMFPTIITVLALLCAAVTGFATANPLFPLVFLLVPLAVIAARVAGDDSGSSRGNRNKPPKM